MANDPFYEAVLSRGSVHLGRAWDSFWEDPALKWRERTGNAPKAAVQAWIDALKRELAHRESIERALG